MGETIVGMCVTYLAGMHNWGLSSPFPAPWADTGELWLVPPAGAKKGLSRRIPGQTHSFPPPA